MARSRRGVPILGSLGMVCLLAVAVTLPAVLQAAGVKTPSAVVTGVLVAALGGVFTDQAKNHFARAKGNRDAMKEGCLMVPGIKRLPLVREIDDPTLVGIRRTWWTGVGAEVPPYVRRDVHHRLVGLLRSGTFVLLVGDRLAGTTRTALEAVRAAVPEHTLIAPSAVDSLRAGVEHVKASSNMVLWLDQLDQYLLPDGLTFNDVRHIVSAGRGRTVIATLSTSNLHRLQNDTSRDTIEARRLIDAASLVRLPVRLSDEEMELAQELSPDERIGEALASARVFGLAEYIGGSQGLFTRWWCAQDAERSSRGASLVRAAVDCRRLGLTSPLDRQMLRELHTIYLADRPQLRHESEDEAWTWALRQWEGSLSLLFPCSGQDGDSSPVDVLPRLVVAARRDDENNPSSRGPEWVRDDVCTRVLARIGPHEAVTVASTAHTYGRYPLVRRAYRHAIDLFTQQHGAEDERTLAAQCDFARWLHIIGAFDEAEQVARRALDKQQRKFGEEDPRTLATRHLMAVLLFDTGRRDSAVTESQAVLALRVRVLGEDHPDTLQSRLALNSMREPLSPDAKVAQLRRELQERVEDADLGPHHDATVTTRFALAIALWQAGLRSEALEQGHIVLDERRRTFGRMHETTVDTVRALATWLGQSGNAAQAATMLAELLAEQERSLDPEQNPRRLRSIRETRDSLAYWLGQASAGNTNNR